MKNTWYRGCRSDLDRKQREAEVLAAKPVLDIVTQWLNDRVQEEQRTRDSEEFHSEYQFSQFQSRTGGKLDAYRRCLALIKGTNINV